MYKLTREQTESLNIVANRLKIPDQWLYDLISRESTWDPVARNKDTGARGLIQFMPKTARGLGFASADELVKKYSTIESQLETPVYNYLKQYAPFASNQAFFMSVFYPAKRNDVNYVFNESVKKVNAGIDSAKHYLAFALGKLKEYRAGTVSYNQLFKKNPFYSVVDDVKKKSQ